MKLKTPKQVRTIKEKAKQAAIDETKRLQQRRLDADERKFLNEFNGARYQEDDLATMDKQFDDIWQETYGYHPKNLPDYWS